MDYTELTERGSGRTTRMLEQIEEYHRDHPHDLIAITAHSHNAEKALIGRLVQRGIPAANLLCGCRTFDAATIFRDMP